MYKIPYKQGNFPIACLGTYKTNPESLVLGLKHGFRLLDSAKAYKNESDIHLAISLSGVDSKEIRVITKLFDKNLCDIQSVRAAVKDSTVKLQRVPDYLLIHGPYPNVPMLAVVKELCHMQKNNLIGNWGVSNFSKEHLQYLEQHNCRPFLNQVEYHPYFQQPELRDYCHEKGIILQAYRPIVEGKVLAEPVLVNLARKYKCTTAQIVYGWLAHQGVAIVSKVASEAHQQEYANAAKVSLEEKDILEIETLHRPNGRTCTAGGWYVPFTEDTKQMWSM